MTINNFFKIKKTAIILSSVLLLISAVFVSCTEDENNGDPFFYVEENPTGLSVDMNENTQSYIVRSNQSWQIVAQGEDKWARAFPDEGDDDGIFKLLIEENNTFDARTMNFAFIVNGKEQPVLFRIDQEANVPYLNVLDSESGISVPSAGGALNLKIYTNVEWTYSLDNEDWLEELDVTDNQINFYAAKNRSVKRSVTLTLSSTVSPDLTKEIIITQSSGQVILEEDFNWLDYGSLITYEYKEAVRYESWTQEEKDHGWDVSPNEFSSNQQLCYAMKGFVKFGKTNYGGDIISPNLDIEGTANVKVSFKSAVYISAAGNVDDRVLKVFALGAGETSVSEFTIDNVPNSQAEDESGIVNNIWDPARGYSFTITGATSDTRIKFLGGDYSLAGVGQGKNRIFLDDVKVEIIQ